MGQHALFAAHIIGGELTYECLGNNQYKFTMKIYRDCLGGGADFDSFGNGLPGTVTIYNGVGNNAQIVKIVNLASPQITSIEPNVSNPCLVVPAGVCVEEGVYEFSLSLNQSPKSYYIIYQRCCRNNTIANIAAPGDSGATYFIELTPESQSECNNSPTFNDFPPIVICAGEEINFDHSATDPDGDVLEYSLCTPYLGGGNNTQSPELPTGVAPNPDLPPPYSPVVFVTPYSFNSPLGGMPPDNLKIDKNTGLLTGVPTTTGQFVVGVCVKEFRNGKLLSTVRRDFQFNVTNCEPTVVADLAKDSLIFQGEDKVYYVRACGALGVPFENKSFQLSNIANYFWEFDLGNGDQIKVEGPGSANWSPTINFPDTGQYVGKLVLNPGLLCNDTANIIVDVFPAIYSDFEYTYDTCIANPVVFTDLSHSDAGPNTLTQWDWSFGDENGSKVQNPVHLYKIPGDLPVALTVTDINRCKATTVKNVRYFPVPKTLVIAPSEFVGCQPANIFFENLSFPIDESYDIVWDFGDGGVGTGVSPTYLYETPGIFTVSVDITSPIGCTTDTTWNDLITILPSPVADFSFTPEQPSSIEPTVQFTDHSIDAAKWRWDFGGLDFSFLPNPSFTFPDTGLHAVTLIVTHESGCRDTMIQFLDVIPEVRYFLPNAFTPNGDGVNDLFLAQGIMEGATNFRMTIWNRYGEQLFETTDPFEGWNGRKNNVGKRASQGVYLVLVTFTGPRGEKVEIRGLATLLD
ncbi:MAG: PKD domain-containing protein [Bacteroidetes bacterium]|nr:MAG: PKD domain-containing protein [Bacteroidota bacterium]